VEYAGTEEAVDHLFIKMPMKKLIIVEHRGKELANRLWNDMSIYAYGRDIGARVVNMTFLEHVRFWRALHTLYARVVDVATRRTCSIWTTGAPKLIPPTMPLPEKYNGCETLYFFGWLFRNPAGLSRHREAIVSAFAPDKRAQRKIDAIMAPTKSARIRIGVHITQKPFKGFENGEFLISPERVRTIVDEYVREKTLSAKDVALVVVSDCAVPGSVFEGYTAIHSAENEKTNMFLLSKCDVIIGFNSTFSNLSAWFGNVPHIVTTDEPIDWEYYRGKTGYFENKYATFTHGDLFYP
jgi:hypothetical protein